MYLFNVRMDTLEKYFRVIAFVALIVGLAALIFGIVAFKKASQLDAVSEVQEANARNSDNIVGLQEQVLSLAKRYTGLVDLENAADQTRRDMQTLGEQLAEVRTQVGSEAVKTAELQARLGMEDQVAQGASSSPVPATTPSPEPAPLTPAEDGSGRMQYTIESGDTLSKVARKLGISLDSLMRANPGIEPRYLRIGQKVYVPGERP